MREFFTGKKRQHTIIYYLLNTTRKCIIYSLYMKSFTALTVFLLLFVEEERELELGVGMLFVCACFCVDNSDDDFESKNSRLFLSLSSN